MSAPSGVSAPAPQTTPPPPVPQTVPGIRGRTISRPLLGVIVVGIVGVVMLVAFKGTPATSATGATPLPGSGRSAAEHQHAAVPEIAEPAPPPTWIGRRQAGWASDGSKTISFALRARHDVPVWMTHVRPNLVVRCLSHLTEVFVETGSAASIEPQDGLHSVRVQIDDGPIEIQQWSDSVSQQELFAPNGLAIARRIARAHRLRFGFTPYNAKPVIADFAVEGFDALAPLVGRTCGWALDEAAVPTPRRSRSS